jgi:hypothetical protein
MDWIVLTAPLAVLPVTLLLGFVGCALNRSGIGVRLVVNYQSGLDVDVKAISVTFTYTVPPKFADNAEIGNTGYTVTTDPVVLNHASIKPDGDGISFLPTDLDVPDVSAVTCSCTVMISPNPSDDSIPGTPHTPSGSPSSRSKAEDDHEVGFSLTRLGAGFQLTAQ